MIWKRVAKPSAERFTAPSLSVGRYKTINKDNLLFDSVYLLNYYHRVAYTVLHLKIVSATILKLARNWCPVVHVWSLLERPRRTTERWGFFAVPGTSRNEYRAEERLWKPKNGSRTVPRARLRTCYFAWPKSREVPAINVELTSLSKYIQIRMLRTSNETCFVSSIPGCSRLGSHAEFAVTRDIFTPKMYVHCPRMKPFFDDLHT